VLPRQVADQQRNVGEVSRARYRPVHTRGHFRALLVGRMLRGMSQIEVVTTAIEDMAGRLSGIGPGTRDFHGQVTGHASAAADTRRTGR
jgi:hypothetical protein